VTTKTIHYSLFTIHYSLFTIHYSLFTKSNTALKLIKEWAVLRNIELEENWKNITDNAAINKIEPLH
jgi:hypothetical protein